MTRKGTSKTKPTKIPIRDFCQAARQIMGEIVQLTIFFVMCMVGMPCIPPQTVTCLKSVSQSKTWTNMHIRPNSLTRISARKFIFQLIAPARNMYQNVTRREYNRKYNKYSSTGSCVCTCVRMSPVLGSGTCESQQLTHAQCTTTNLPTTMTMTKTEPQHDNQHPFFLQLCTLYSLILLNRLDLVVLSNFLYSVRKKGKQLTASKCQSQLTHFDDEGLLQVTGIAVCHQQALDPFWQSYATTQI